MGEVVWCGGWGWIRHTRGVVNESACRLALRQAGGALVVYAAVCVRLYGR